MTGFPNHSSRRRKSMKKLSTTLLAITLIALGLMTFVPSIPFISYVVGGLAIATGVLILIKR
jgi:uncharacterized membrane protein